MSMAMKYAMQKRARKGCECNGAGCDACMAKGGEVSAADAGEEGIVDRIMKRFAKSDAPMADEEPADFDAMDAMDMPIEADEPGGESGDETGEEEADDDDIAARAMKSRKKGAA